EPLPAGGLNAPQGLVAALLIEIDDDDLATFPSEPLTRSATDSGTTPCHHADSIGEPHRNNYPFAPIVRTLACFVRTPGIRPVGTSRCQRASFSRKRRGNRCGVTPLCPEQPGGRKRPSPRAKEHLTSTLYSRSRLRITCHATHGRLL